jgi:hypothetical protein
MSDWGKGAKNNNIGWGQGFENIISWGSVYPVSYSGETNITGALDIIETIITNFKNRVAADLGSFEAEENLRIILTNLSTT